MEDDEEKMQKLRSKAAELHLREEWEGSVQAYSDFISFCEEKVSKAHLDYNSDHLYKLKKSLCLALSNRAEARARLQEYPDALSDCDEALRIENAHFKTLLCKGKILLSLDRYSAALDCFKKAYLDPQASSNSEMLVDYLERCKKLEALSKNGALDLSDWILNGFKGKSPELAEYIGPVEIKKSEISGRGLFATKNIDTGTLLLINKAITTERGILPQSSNDDLGENAQLAMWKNFIDKVVESTRKDSRTHNQISKLSRGDNDDKLDVPEINQFKPEAEVSSLSDEKLDMGTILNILDVNSLVEDAVSSNVLGKTSDYHGVGLWILASFINHSCEPNVRRLHIGDHLIIHASKDIKAGEELTFSYFDVLLPLSNREGMAKGWGFNCKCKRCQFEYAVCPKQELREIERILGKGLDKGGVVYRLEECIRRWMVRGKGKGYIRASFWAAYSEVYESEKLMRRWGRRIPSLETVVDSVVDAVGSDERIVKVLTEGLKRKNGNVSIVAGMLEMERAMKLGRGIYGKVMKKQALRTLLQLGVHDH